MKNVKINFSVLKSSKSYKPVLRNFMHTFSQIFEEKNTPREESSVQTKGLKNADNNAPDFVTPILWFGDDGVANDPSINSVIPSITKQDLRPALVTSVVCRRNFQTSEVLYGTKIIKKHCFSTHQQFVSKLTRTHQLMQLISQTAIISGSC